MEEYIIWQVISQKNLYWRGEWRKELFAKCMGVVGSRRMTSYGERVLERMIPQLVQQGWTIVSGFMYGVDKTAHRLALANGGKTIAVLGWGIENEGDGDEELKDKIIENGGLIMSQWKDQIATNWTFPMRNKIVAQVCQEVIVVEAAGKSGALITADLAIKYGKKLWAVPGPVMSAVSVGTNRLIAEGKAQMWVGEAEVSKLLKEPKLLRLLKEEPMDTGELARRLGKPVEEVGAELTIMVLSGQLTEKGGKYYIG